MRKNVVATLLLLTLACAFTAAYGQVSSEGKAASNGKVRLSPYGTVLSLPGPNGHGVSSFQYEGYALTYRYRDPRTGRQETRFLYAFGSQHASRSLLPGRVQGPAATLKTSDGLLEITSTVECGEGQPCRLTRTFKNASRDESVVIEVVQAESMIDASRLLDGAYRGAYLDGGVGCSDPCPPAPCGRMPPCEPPGHAGISRPFLNYAEISNGLPFRLASLDKTSPLQVAILSWLEGVNAKFESLRVGHLGATVTVLER